MSGIRAADAFEPGVAGTDRWRGIGAAALLAGGLGLVTRRPGLLLVGALGVVLVGYARTVAPPALSLSIHREIERVGGAEESGDTARVRLAVENVGGRTIPDLRLADGVPPTLSVINGSAGAATPLRPGESATIAYEVSVREGSHEFGQASAVARDVAGIVERRAHVDVTGDDSIEDAPGQRAVAPPLRTPSARFAGQAATTPRSDAGVTFHGIREYRPGDDVGRIDWHRFARTGRLATVDYEAERGSSVVVAVDARAAAHRAPASGEPSAVERSLSAAAELAAGIAAAGHRLGLARIGPDPQWIAPSRGQPHARRVRETLADRPPFEGEGAAEPEWLAERLESRVELLLVTPLTDGPPVELARRLQATGTPVTVLSPDPTSDATAGQQLAGIEREERLRSLRADGVAVADWPTGTPVEHALRDLEGGR